MNHTLLTAALAAVAFLPSCLCPAGFLDPSKLEASLRDVASTHDAYVATEVAPDGAPLDPLEVEVRLATTAELIKTLDAALAEQAKE